ncbi:unnamed protein product [Durusdinium trenchii]|uniref:Uncharacterized protein n=1 Tax=Durusdinium trenchii TaxID=1381693 RepID=A0ABP0PYR1_9DINO
MTLMVTLKSQQGDKINTASAKCRSEAALLAGLATEKAANELGLPAWEADELSALIAGEVTFDACVNEKMSPELLAVEVGKATHAAALAAGMVTQKAAEMAAAAVAVAAA